MEKVTALDSGKIKSLLDPKLARGLNLLDSVGSTNLWLLKHIGCEDNNLPVSGQSCITEEQTMGRGRRGRVWTSVKGGDITFSIAWSVQRTRLSGALPLAVAVKVAEILENYAAIKLSIKWPNDIYFGDQKLVGILSESVSAAAPGPNASIVVVGVGVNIVEASANGHGRIGLQELIDNLDIDRQAGSKMPVDRNRVFAALLTGLAECLDTFDRDGFKSFIDRYNARDYLVGKNIVVKEQQQEWYATSSGLAIDGGLVVDDESGRRRVLHAADVTIRWRDGSAD